VADVDMGAADLIQEVAGGMWRRGRKSTFDSDRGLTEETSRGFLGCLRVGR
jgi:hypothetical protein